MSLKRLELFGLLAKHSSITKVAEILRVSQSSISHQLTLLKRDFGRGLYQLNGRGIEFTAKGWNLYKETQAFLDLYESLKKKYREDAPTESAVAFTIGGSYGTAAALLPSLIEEFTKEHPEVVPFLRTANRNAIERLVLQGEVEIALVTLPIRSRLLAIEPYRQEKLAAFVSKNHPLARKAKIPLPELFLNPLVIRGERDVNSRIKEILLKHESEGYKPRIVACYDLPDAVKEAVRRKMGVGFLYEDLVRTEAQRRDFKIVTVEGLDLTSQSFIVYHKERSLSAHAKDFLSLLYRRRIDGVNVSPSTLSPGFRRKRSGPTRRNIRTA